MRNEKGAKQKTRDSQETAKRQREREGVGERRQKSWECK